MVGFREPVFMIYLEGEVISTTLDACATLSINPVLAALSNPEPHILSLLLFVLVWHVFSLPYCEGFVN